MLQVATITGCKDPHLEQDYDPAVVAALATVTNRLPSTACSEVQVAAATRQIAPAGMRATESFGFAETCGCTET